MRFSKLFFWACPSPLPTRYAHPQAASGRVLQGYASLRCCAPLPDGRALTPAHAPRPLLTLLLCLLALPFGFAQMRGGIRGQVTDENSGDAVSFAQIILLQDDALVQATVTDHDGNYFMGNILPGTYAVLARGQGFSPLKITEIPLAEGEWLDISPSFPNESFDTDTLIQKYQPPTNPNNPPKKGGKKPKAPKKTAYQRRLERAARKIK